MREVRSHRGNLDVLPYIVIGITTGAIYGLAATGLTLTYKTSGIFNFAHGAIATASAYVWYWLNHDQGWHWLPAVLVAVFVLGPALGLFLERISRRLSNQRTAMKIVGTVGMILVVQGLASVKYGEDTIRVPQYLPKGDDLFSIRGTNVTYSQLTILIISLVCVAGLFIFFRTTRMGLAMRAVVDSPDLLDLSGTSPTVVRRTAWIIGAMFASLSGVLMVPIFGLNSIILTLLVVQAMAGAAVGYFSSIPLTYAGSMLIGVFAALSRKTTGWPFDWLSSHSWWSNTPNALPFIVLFVVLLALPKRYLVRPSAPEQRPHLNWRGPPELRAGIAAVLLGLAILLPHVGLWRLNGRLVFFSQGLTGVLMILSLGLLVKTSGQVSLCHTAFAAIGAAVFSQLRVEHGWPWLLALLVGCLVAVPVGAIVAIPAIRLSGLFLALATFGFGLLLESLLFKTTFMFGSITGGRAMPRPSFAESDNRYYYLLLAFAVLTAVVMLVIERSRLGRILRGMSDSPVALSTMGLSVNVTRVIVFCISSYFAAISGVLFGCLVFFADPNNVNYTSFYSLVLIALLALAPFGVPWYGFVGFFAAALPGILNIDGNWTILHFGRYTGGGLSNHTTAWLNTFFGFFAVLVSLEGGPGVLGKGGKNFWGRIAIPRHSKPVAVTMAPAAALGAMQASVSRLEGLDVTPSGPAQFTVSKRTFPNWVIAVSLLWALVGVVCFGFAVEKLSGWVIPLAIAFIPLGFFFLKHHKDVLHAVAEAVPNADGTSTVTVSRYRDPELARTLLGSVATQTVESDAQKSLRLSAVERVDIAARSGLEVRNLQVRFGGLVAVQDFSLKAPTGTITGLIGPNGAGKTTTFNACSGLNKPSSGSVWLHGQDVSSLSPAARGRHGLGRTFQRMELCETLTVHDNVALGRESGLAGARLFSQLAAKPAERRLMEGATAAAMSLCGITDLAQQQAGALSTGQRRLVELARCLAGPFDLLLLDEPSSGLDREETRQFGQVLKAVVAERSLGILLVEHDMSLVMSVCDFIYVLDFGKQIFEGSAAEVASSPIVKAAYLGDEAVEGLTVDQ
jgi:ABC-type branched-subunit amino acid transport system ATPase component/branched-subunit amino acid ABC-type transport system permease component